MSSHSDRKCASLFRGFSYQGSARDEDQFCVWYASQVILLITGVRSIVANRVTAFDFEPRVRLLSLSAEIGDAQDDFAFFGRRPRQHLVSDASLFQRK